MKHLTLLLLLVAAIAGGLHAQTDYTNAVTNPGFETGNSNGWTWTGATGYAWLGPNTDGDATKEGNYINGLWNSSIGDVEFSQTLTDLPEGIYQVTALVTVSTNRLTNQRIFAETDGTTASTLFGAANHPAYNESNLAILSQTENYSFGGHRESVAENGPFQILKVQTHVVNGELKIGMRLSGKSTGQGYDFSHTPRNDAGFFKFDHFTLTEVSDWASLDRISLNKGYLNTSFNPGTYTYNATLPTGTVSVTPSATPSVEGAVVTGLEEVDVTSGSGSSAITVTALDGISTKTYTVNYTVAEPVDFSEKQKEFYNNEFSLSQVSLLEGPFKQAQDLNVSTLLAYDTDRLLEPFVVEAGLETDALRYPNWEDLAGSIGGHYLSAVAMSYAATGNSELKERLDYMISTLKNCQVANGNGYLGGVPNGKTMWDQVKAGNISANGFTLNDRWVPWYNVHKIFAGLRDAWYYTGNALAAQMFLDLCNWGLTIISDLDDQKLQAMLVAEFGGMNEVYADAYKLSGEIKYLDAAKRFTHNSIFSPLSQHNDHLDNMHANTQVPKAVGFGRIAEVDPEATAYYDAANFFWHTVVDNRTLALGGNSRREHFPSSAASIDYINDVEGPESCNTHNMLKLTEHLFRISAESKYADYYERALYNHVLSAIHPEHGGYVYFTPARPRHYRVYSAPNEAMWCCVGTGMENPGKYAKFIYTKEEDSLLLNLFISSELAWEEKNVVVRQETNFPYEEKTKLYLFTEGSVNFNLLIRYPEWVTDGALKIVVNGDTLQTETERGRYLSIDRTWNNNDSVHVVLPMKTRFEELPNLPQYLALMHGPILLGAKTGVENLDGLIADDSRWGHIAAGKLLPLNEAPIIVSEKEHITDKIIPIEGEPLRFNASQLLMEDTGEELILEPFYTIHDARYMMYWMALGSDEYQQIRDSLETIEQDALKLQARTLDQVAPGEQQPEVDHKIQILNSDSGSYMGESWRDAKDGGYLSYELNTRQKSDLSLMLRYWGNETGSRSFNIYIDDQLIATENIVGKWNLDEFVNMEYPIPNELTEGKDFIRIKLQGINNNNVAGGVFYVRLLEQSTTTNIPGPKTNNENWQLRVRKNTLYIEALPENSLVKVFDLSGRVVAQKKTNQVGTTIDQLTPGIKIVQVQVNGIPYTYKIFIQ